MSSEEEEKNNTEKQTIESRNTAQSGILIKATVSGVDDFYCEYAKLNEVNLCKVFVNAAIAGSVQLNASYISRTADNMHQISHKTIQLELNIKLREADLIHAKAKLSIKKAALEQAIKSHATEMNEITRSAFSTFMNLYEARNAQSVCQHIADCIPCNDDNIPFVASFLNALTTRDANYVQYQNAKFLETLRNVHRKFAVQIYVKEKPNEFNQEFLKPLQTTKTVVHKNNNKKSVQNSNFVRNANQMSVDYKHTHQKSKKPKNKKEE
jgi:hypothetical protein